MSRPEYNYWRESSVNEVYSRVRACRVCATRQLPVCHEAESEQPWYRERGLDERGGEWGGFARTMPRPHLITINCSTRRDRGSVDNGCLVSCWNPIFVSLNFPRMDICRRAFSPPTISLNGLLKEKSWWHEFSLDNNCISPCIRSDCLEQRPNRGVLKKKTYDFIMPQAMDY